MKWRKDSVGEKKVEGIKGEWRRQKNQKQNGQETVELQRRHGKAVHLK